ncbi:copper resistance protein CopC [Micrococcaceae bacterium Sec5.7]
MKQGSRGAATAGRLVRGMLAAAATAMLLILPAGSAAAHAELRSSDPAPGAVLAAQPSAITLTFSEPVEVNDDVIEVFDDRFNRVDVGHPSSSDPQQAVIEFGLRSGLAEGTYTVNWSAGSADTHLESGSYQFSVGHASVVRGTAPENGRNDLAGVLLGVLRWAGYVGLLLGPGVLLVTLGQWPAGLADRRARALTITGLSLLALSTVGTMVLQGIWASGEPFSALWSAPDKLDTHSRRFDQVYALRSYLLLGFAVALVAALSRSAHAPTRPRRVLLGAATVSTVALVATWPLAGHSASGDGSEVAMAANFVHTLAMTVWLGGLALILVALRPAERAPDLAAVLPRFSRVALASVAALVVTGVFMAWREVGTVNALTGSAFGGLLLVKLSGVAALIPVSNLARRWVKRHLPAGTPGMPVPRPDPPDQSLAPTPTKSLLTGLMAEATIASGVLVVTAALVVIAPPR